MKMIDKEIPTSTRLMLAFAKLKRDNARSGKSAPSISAVAREAGVSHTLIHTKYAELALKINEERGRSPKRQLEKHRTLAQQAEDRSAELRGEVAALKTQNKGLASENARLLLTVKALEKKIFALESGAKLLKTNDSAHN
jgi:hypothetical protein